MIEYSVDGKTGSLYYDHPYIGELYVSDRKIGTADHNKFCKIFNNVEDIKNKSNDVITVTYKVTFELELKKIEMTPKPKLLHKLYSEGKFSDIKIYCHGKVFDCHKIILCGTSEVFKKIIFEIENDMENDMVKGTSGKIKITDISPITMENLLFYIYHEDLLKVEAKIVLDLLWAAYKYAIFDLVKMCVKVLKESLSKKNVVDVMTTAFSTNQEDLFESAYQFNFNLRMENQNVDIEAWKELEEKNPNLAKQMTDPKMMKKANISVKDLKESILPMKIEAKHQKWIKATEEWTQLTQKGKRATYFDRNFSINDMTWRRLGNLKFNVKLWTDSDRWPRVCMDNNISKEVLSDFKLLIEYSVDGNTGSLYYDHPYIGELYVSDRKVGTADHKRFCKIFNNAEDIKNKSNDIITVTYKVTFELELKKIEMLPKPKLRYY